MPTQDGAGWHELRAGMSYGTHVAWKVGDRAKWFGKPSIPMGASNPPAPGSPWNTSPAWRDLWVTVVDVTEVQSRGGLVPFPIVVRADDGTLIDPRVYPDMLVSADHEGWRHPNPEFGR